MKTLITSITCVLSLAVSTVVNAEIYESKDAKGNTVFTDSPSAGATKVDLPEGNIADAVQPRPAEEADKAITAPTAPAAATHRDDAVVIIPNSNNERVEDEYLEGRRHEVLEGETPPEVGDSEREGRPLEHEAIDEVVAPRPAVRPHPGVHRR